MNTGKNYRQRHFFNQNCVMKLQTPRFSRSTDGYKDIIYLEMLNQLIFHNEYSAVCTVRYLCNIES